MSTPRLFIRRHRRTQREQRVTLHLAIFVPLFYVCFCAYLSIGRLGMFSFYTLVPYGTDSLSLLFNASLVCRYSAPLAYNFLALLPVLSRPSVPPTTFAKKMAEHIPEAAHRFNTIVPGFLAIYCALIAFDAFDGIASYGWKILCCCCPTRLRGGLSGRSSMHHRTSIGSDEFGSNMIGDQNAFHFASAKDEEMEDDSLGRSIVDRERAEIIEGGRLDALIRNITSTNRRRATRGREGVKFPLFPDAASTKKKIIR